MLDKFWISVFAILFSLAGGALLHFFQKAPPVPVFWKVLNAGLGGLGARMNRPQRRIPDLRFRGVAYYVFIAGAVFLALGMLDRVSALYPPWGLRAYLALETGILASCLSTGGLWALLFRLGGGSAASGLNRALARGAGLDLSGADDFALARGAISWSARMLVCAFFAPVLIYLVMGLPGALLYSCAAWIVHTHARGGLDKGFSWIAGWIDRVLGVIPAVCAGGFLVLAAAVVPYAGISRALAGLFKSVSGGGAPYLQGGTPLTVLAYAFETMLGGPALGIDGYKRADQWVGPDGGGTAASAKVPRVMMARAAYSYTVSCVIFLAFLVFYG